MAETERRFNMKEILSIISVIVAIFLGLFALVYCTVGWCDGHAKSAYIMQTQGVYVPWYYATWLQVNVQDVNARVKQ